MPDHILPAGPSLPTSPAVPPGPALPTASSLPPVSAPPPPIAPPVPSGLDWIRAAPEDATGPGPWIEVAFGPDDRVYLRETSDPGNVVITTRRKWDAFVLGVQAGEFDHFVAGLEEGA